MGQRTKSYAFFFILLIASVSPVSGEHRLSGVQINPVCVGASVVGVFATAFTGVLAALETSTALHPAEPAEPALPPPIATIPPDVKPLANVKTLVSMDLGDTTEADLVNDPKKLQAITDGFAVAAKIDKAAVSVAKVGSTTVTSSRRLTEVTIEFNIKVVSTSTKAVDDMVKIINAVTPAAINTEIVKQAIAQDVDLKITVSKVSASNPNDVSTDPNEDKVNGDFGDEGFADDPMSTHPVSEEEEECFMEMDLDPSHCAKSHLWHGIGTSDENPNDCYTACLPSVKPAECPAEAWADLHDTSIKKSTIHPNIGPDGSLLKVHNGMSSSHPTCSGTIRPVGGSAIQVTDDEEPDDRDDGVESGDDHAADHAAAENTGRGLAAHQIDQPDMEEFMKSLENNDLINDDTLFPGGLEDGNPEEVARRDLRSSRRRRRRRRRARAPRKFGSRIKSAVQKTVSDVKKAATAVKNVAVKAAKDVVKVEVAVHKVEAKVVDKVAKDVEKVAVKAADAVAKVAVEGADAVAKAAVAVNTAYDNTAVGHFTTTHATIIKKIVKKVLIIVAVVVAVAVLTVVTAGAADAVMGAIAGATEVTDAVVDTAEVADTVADTVEATDTVADTANAVKDGDDVADATEETKDAADASEDGKDVKDTEETAKDTTEEDDECTVARRLCEANSGHARRLCEQATRKLCDAPPPAEPPAPPAEPPADADGVDPPTDESSVDLDDTDGDSTYRDSMNRIERQVDERPDMTRAEMKENTRMFNEWVDKGPGFSRAERKAAKLGLATAEYGTAITVVGAASVTTAVGFSIDAVVKKVDRGGFGCRSENHRCAVGDCCSTLACKRKQGYAEPVCQAVSTPSPTHPPTEIPVPDQVPTTFPTMAPTVLTCPMCVSQNSTWCLANGLCYGKGTPMPSVCNSASGCANNLKPSVCSASCADEPPTSAVDLGTDKPPTMPQAQPQVRIYDNSTTTPVYANITFCVSVNASYLASQNLTVEEAKLGIAPVFNFSSLHQKDFGKPWRMDMYRPVSTSRRWEGDFEYYNYNSITLKFPNSTGQGLVGYPPTAKSPGMQDGDCVDAFPMDQTK